MSIDHEIRMAACLAVCEQTRAWARYMRVGSQACTNDVVASAWMDLLACDGRLSVSIRKVLERPVNDAKATYPSVAACIEDWLKPNHLMKNPYAVLAWFQSMAREVYWRWAREEIDWAFRVQRAKGEEEFRKALWRIWPLVAFGGAEMNGHGWLFLVPDATLNWIYDDDSKPTTQLAGEIPMAIKTVPETMPARLTKAEWDALGVDGQYVYQERMGIGEELGMPSDEAHRIAVSEARMEADRTPAGTRTLIGAAMDAFGGELLSVRPRKGV